MEVLDDVMSVPAAVEINKENPYVLICVYGTLRKGEGNYRRILENTDSEHLGTYRSEKNFTMYGRKSGFPIITEGSSSIVYEVFKVKDQNVLNRLHSLEGCSGIPGHKDNWYDIVPIETPHGQGWIYLQHGYKPYAGDISIIPTGDWKNKSI